MRYCESAYCDWDNTQYWTFSQCYERCTQLKYHDAKVYISKADFTADMALAGLLFGVVFLYATLKSIL